MSAERPDEQALRDARLSELYRESGAPEPSAEIDQSILAAARREVHAGPRRLGHWMRQWRVPMSIAATVVVSATLVMVMVEEGGDRLESPPPPASAPVLKESAAPQTAPMQDSTPRGAALPDERGERRSEAPAPRSTESDSAASRQALESRSRPEPTPEARLPQGPESRPKREPAPEARPPAEAPRAQPAPPPPALARPFPATPPAPEAAPRAEVEDRVAPRPESVAPPRAAEAPARDAQGGRTGGGLSARRERADDAGSAARLGARGFTDMPQGEGQGLMAPSQDAIGRADPSEPQKARGPDTHAQERAGAAAPATAPAAKRALSPIQAPKPRPESRGAVLARDLADQPPEKWLERVEQLRREERLSDADHLMVEFRRRFPEHPAAQRAP